MQRALAMGGRRTIFARWSAAVAYSHLVALALVLLGLLTGDALAAGETDLNVADTALEAAVALCPICWSSPSLVFLRFAERMGLTARELQVARCASTGTCSGDIARHLGISRRTVETHLRRVFAKLEIHNRTRLAYLLANALGEPQRLLVSEPALLR